MVCLFGLPNRFRRHYTRHHRIENAVPEAFSIWSYSVLMVGD